MSCSVIIEPAPLSGAQNMAIDEGMLQAAIEDDFCGLRFYQWEKPTLSLGYFQKPETMSLEQRFLGLPIVRRLSGGGAILHDRELTYSCAIPSHHAITKNPSQLYDVVHEVVIEVLSKNGVNCTFRAQAQTELDSAFLCFLRGDPRDLIIDGQKILGSAQRRRKGAILQHGSLILSTSEHAPEIPGISELSGTKPLEFRTLSEQISEALAPKLKQIHAEVSHQTWDKIRGKSDSFKKKYFIPASLFKTD